MAGGSLSREREGRLGVGPIWIPQQGTPLHMEEEKRSRGEELRRFILAQIEEKGSIPFSQFMEWCLYHPEYGYYQTKGTRIGKGGDYYTSPSVSPLFGHLIGKQLLQMAEILGGENFDVVEMGAGSGFLCEDILDWAKKNLPAFYQRLRYYLIETAPPFSQAQKERLAEEEREGKVFRMDLKKSRDGEIRIQGCFLSNELFDAFPVHRVILDQGNLRELYVTQQEGQFEERGGEPSDQRF